MSRGPLDAWYESAGVRGGVRRLLHDESDDGKVFFPERLVPYLAHEAVVALPAGRRRELAVRHLYQFLLSTTHLETRVVNRGAELIANDRCGVPVAARTRLDAFKVYCDEGYHSLYSLDLADQVAATTGIAVPRWDYGGFVTRLADTAARTLPAHPALAPLLQTVVFETLITSVLNEVPADTGVVTTVRDLVRDHAKDEGRHHRFFTAFFHELWHGLDTGARTAVAFALPALLKSCLVWDVEPVRSSLRLAGLDAPAAAAVVDNCYRGETGDERVRAICRAALRMCASAGVFEVPGAVDVFAAHGLLTGGEA
ncbi:diiron oxygenase [Amycolatopsis sp. OK19-0408]|uniref:Diiron oxygenase n=1 Tax=Amycolatopsis iheyensis TaxID=2945988 RepID=A0A9X2SMA0_9PSEU|nr:diiron oxygenase [Amycolatopsis iheyensis]MCR6487389.1 diiron oxygenase [Amycolatopsis iheyensis]